MNVKKDILKLLEGSQLKVNASSKKFKFKKACRHMESRQDQEKDKLKQKEEILEKTNKYLNNKLKARKWKKSFMPPHGKY